MKQLLCYSRTESFNIFFTIIPITIRWVWRHIGWVIAFGPEGRGFESHSSRHATDLGQVLHLQLPVALRRVNSDTVSIAVVVSASE